MATKEIFTVQQNKPIAADVWQMQLEGSTAAIYRPGQFVNIALDGFYLRRPISVNDWGENSLTIIYKIMGRGTKQLTTLLPGAKLDILVGLGNGFDPAPAKGKKIVLAGGGVGVPPLYGLAKALIAQGDMPVAAFGFRTGADVFAEEAFAALGCKVHIATEDGSHGVKGFITSILQETDYDYYYTCGPKPMLKALYALGEEKGAAGQISMEERMGCGFGACMGCSCKTKTGSKRVCTEGPVFLSSEVLF